MKTVLDMRYAARLLLKRPGATALSLGVLSGGLAVAIFTFSFIYRITYKPLPMENGRDLVVVLGRFGTETGLLRPVDYAAMKGKAKGLSAMSAHRPRGVVMNEGDGPILIQGIFCEWEFFNLTQTEPHLGRGFQPQDHAEGAPPVAVIGYQLWQDRFKGDPHILQREIVFNSQSTRITGVMPKGFHFPVAADLWLPLSQKELNTSNPNAFHISIRARLNPGHDAQSVAEELSQLLRDAGNRDDTLADGAVVMSVPLAQVSDTGPTPIWALQLVALLILCLACINVASLVLFKVNERAKETAVRLALGAPSRRLTLQMTWETVILAALAGFIALLPTGWGLEVVDLWFHELFPGGGPFWWHWGLDPETLLAAIGFTLLAMVLTGWLPSWWATRINFNAVLRDGTRGALGRKQNQTGQRLIVAQIALVSLVTYFLAVAIVITYRTRHVELGVTLRGLATAGLQLPPEDYPEAQDHWAFFQQLQHDLRGNYQLESILLQPVGESLLETPGTSAGGKRSSGQVQLMAISGHLDLVGFRLLEGVFLDHRGGAEILVSQSLAQAIWPGTSPLGKTLRVTGEAKKRTVVGVVSDINLANPISGESRTLAAYLPMGQFPNRRINIIFPDGGESGTGSAALLAALQKRDPRVVPFQILAFDQLREQAATMAGFAQGIILQCGLFAILVAVCGIYGIAANNINRQTHEIGLRRALGCTDSQIVHTFLKRGTYWLGLGFMGAVLVVVPAVYWSLTLLPLQPAVYLGCGMAVACLVSPAVLAAIYLATKAVVRLEPNAALRLEQ